MPQLVFRSSEIGRAVKCSGHDSAYCFDCGIMAQILANVNHVLVGNGWRTPANWGLYKAGSICTARKDGLERLLTRRGPRAEGAFTSIVECDKCQGKGALGTLQALK
uniref:Protein yippee-like n=1 Tax=Steinernema glaseri TaxID=37863 RepID=A0A1I7YF62_9BILA